MADVRTNIRIPEALYEEIKQLAEKDFRSINGEIIALLYEAVRRRRTEQESEEEIGVPELALASTTEPTRAAAVAAPAL